MHAYVIDLTFTVTWFLTHVSFVCAEHPAPRYSDMTWVVDIARLPVNEGDPLLPIAQVEAASDMPLQYTIAVVEGTANEVCLED
jgi:hypothetical protein